MSIGPIPFTAIAEFAKINKIDDFHEFLYIIRVLDNIYLEDQQKKERNNASSNSN